jgi:hypothetical protein
MTRSSWCWCVPLWAVLAAGCGGADPSPPAGTPSRVPARKGPPAPPPGTLWRHDVVAAVDRGLGWFLRYHVQVEGLGAGGKFVGWRIENLGPPEFWQGVELRRGDIVTSVNGQPIERPAQAYAVFESLKKADRLTVAYLRGGEERELSYRIKEAPRSP